MQKFVKIYLCLVLMMGLSILAKPTILESAKDPETIISNVSTDRKSFMPGNNQKVKINYYLSKSSEIAVSIYDSKNNLVRTIKLFEAQMPGYRQVVWDGKDTAGKILPGDIYTYMIEAKDILTKQAHLHDLTNTQGKRVNVRRFKWDKKGKIAYSLPEAALVNLRVGIKNGGPLLRSLLNQQPQTKGRHTIHWDGWDNSKVMYLLEREDLLVDIQAMSLAKNSIIIKGNNLSKEKLEPGFDFKILNPIEYKDNNIAVVKDQANIEVNLSQEDKEQLIKSRFEIMFFIDTQFIYEEEEPKVSPFVYKWDFESVKDGEHILTVNILDPDDRAVASKSKKIIVKKDKDV